MDLNICICIELIDKGLLNGICKQIKPIDIVIMKKVKLTGLEGLMYLYSIYWIIYQGKLSTTLFCLFSPQFKNEHLLLEQLTVIPRAMLITDKVNGKTQQAIGLLLLSLLSALSRINRPSYLLAICKG